MKKYLLFLIITIIFIILYFFFINGEESYSINYELNNYKVVETYDKDNKFYKFEIMTDELNIDFVYDGKYTKSRKIINKINKKDINEYVCYQLKFNNNDKTEFVCIDDNKNYVSSNIANNYTNNDKVLSSKNNIEIYNDSYDYYLWSGFGFKEVNSGTNFKFLKNESYDNNLYYIYNDTLLIADYDQNRTFNKFYLFNTKEKSIEEFEFDFNISFDSYFMGDYKDYIYLFDKKNSVQYKINIEKKKISISSDKNGGFFYDYKESTKSLKELKYKEVTFNKYYLYNYVLIDNALYLKYFNSDINIKVTNRSVDSIIQIDNKDVYYLSEDTLYHYSVNGNEEILLKYFEWNFSSNDKIFIFN